jgi:hypothetical protein
MEVDINILKDGHKEVVDIMDYDEVYEEIHPYLSDPGPIKEFLDKYKDIKIEEIIEKVNDVIADSDAILKTDYRILLNALLKRH